GGRCGVGSSAFGGHFNGRGCLGRRRCRRRRLGGWLLGGGWCRRLARRFTRRQRFRLDRRLGRYRGLDLGCLGGLAAFLLLAALALRFGGLPLGHGRISSLWVAVAGAPPVAVPAAGSDSYLSWREDIQAILEVFPRFSGFFGDRPGEAPCSPHDSAGRFARAPGALVASNADQQLLWRESAGNGSGDDDPPATVQPRRPAQRVPAHVLGPPKGALGRRSRLCAANAPASRLARSSAPALELQCEGPKGVSLAGHLL